MSGLDAMAVGGVIGLVITGVMWWRIDILPQIRDLRRKRLGTSDGER